MNAAQTKRTDSKYWVRQAYSKSLLEELVGEGEPDIKKLAPLCNFLGYINQKVWCAENPAKLINTIIHADHILDSDKIYKGFKFMIMLKPQTPITTLTHSITVSNPSTASIPLTPIILGQQHRKAGHTIMSCKTDTTGIQPIICAEYGNMKMITIASDKLPKLLERDYTKTLSFLTKHGLIRIDDSYIKKNGTHEGKCKSYGITRKGEFLLDDSQKQYLYKLKTDTTLQKTNRKNLNRSGYFKKSYPDLVLQNTKENIDNISNADDLVDLIPAITVNEGDNHKAAQRVARHCMIQIMTKKYNDLQVNRKTGRIYPPTATLPKRIKKSAIINGREFICSIDIRSCIPTFFGLYCLKLRKDRQKARELDINSTALSKEIEAYTAIFCSESEHPRTYLAGAFKDDLGHSASEDEIKSMLNEGLNGSGSEECKLFRSWIKQRYPNMHRVWMTTDIRTTGSNLSKHYESPIFRNKKVINMAKKHFLEYVDNHDEALLYGDSYNAEKFIKWFIPFARRTVGIDVQFSIEITNNK